MRKIIIGLLIAGVFISGCVQAEKAGEDEIDIAGMCMQLCKAEKEGGTDLTDGPCISDDNLDWTIEDWVCDVAHFPRQAIDNKIENQCREFREGKAHHFIEVDPDCQLIEKV